MLTKNNRTLGLYVDRFTHQWVVRDPEGNLWALPPSEDGCWEQRLPFEFTAETDLESVPGHYKYLLDLPF